jgi:hypothetical protein
MNYKYIALSFFLFVIGQILVWVQVNGPLIWPWAKTWKWALILLGVPITWLFMLATETVVKGFDGLFWPGRFISFCAGIFIFTVMTYLFRDEPITAKTAISLALAFILLSVQLFWK